MPRLLRATTVDVAACRAAFFSVTTIRLSDSEAAAALLAHLGGQQDLWVERIGEARLRVSVMGSYAVDAMQLELYLRIRAWEAAEHARGRSVSVEFEDD